METYQRTATLREMVAYTITRRKRMAKQAIMRRLRRLSHDSAIEWRQFFQSLGILSAVLVLLLAALAVVTNEAAQMLISHIEKIPSIYHGEQ